MPASSIDFTTLTHVIHFSVLPNSNGTLDSSTHGITMGNSADVVTRAHAAGRKVLLCVGGGGTESLFQGATSVANLPVFINNLTNFVATRNYDGVDIDWEPLPTSDAQQFTNLVIGLRSALNGFAQPKLLTVAAAAYPPYGDSATAQYVMFSALQSQFDRINIMTYDLAGPYDGWVTWFNSPIYDGGFHFPGGGRLLPSVEGAVNYFLTNGVAPTKLGIGIAFYGYLWTGGSSAMPGGITQPRQSWINAPTATAIRYHTIMTDHYQSSSYHWDANAQAAYLSITNASPANSMFISYDDQRTCQSKVSYARNRGLGGVMIWEIAQDHSGSQPGPLLEAVKQALAAPGVTGIQLISEEVNLSFTGLPLGSYRVQWIGDLTAGVWNTLTVTNITNAGGIVRVADTNSFGASQRFYRVQTPP